MNDSGKNRDDARQRVARLLAARLERGGVSTSRPEWYFACEAEEPQRYPGGTQVRVRTWRHWSDARVHFEVDGGAICYQSVDRLSDPPGDAHLTADAAEAIARAALRIPADAQRSSFRHEPFAPGRTMARIEWSRVHDGLPVAGDFIYALIHPGTHRLVAFGRKWRELATAARR